MIYYFTGTGNSRYVAERIAAITHDSLTSINDALKKENAGSFTGDAVFVTPTYAWRIPRVVQSWIANAHFEPAKAWFVMTCGDGIGNAGFYNRLLCEKIHFRYMGTAKIIMPENYIAMFNAPHEKEAKQIILKAEPDIREAGEKIKAGAAFNPYKGTPGNYFLSGIVNRFFYPTYVKAKAFYVKNGCIGCGKCAELCPLHNITLKDGKPVWGSNCTHCMACICHCPREAIEYGKKSIGKPRYTCPDMDNRQ